MLDRIKRKKKQDKKTKQRPAWALAESLSGDEIYTDKSVITNYSSEEQFLGDEELLDFAADLDFERDTQDMELRSMINVLESRIGELEKEVKKEGEIINDSSTEDRSTSCITVNSQQKHDKNSRFSSTTDKKSGRDAAIEDEDKVLLHAARNLLSSRYSKFLHSASRSASRSKDEDAEGKGEEASDLELEDEHALQLIHSQRSLAAVLKALRRSFLAANANTLSTEAKPVQVS